MQWEWINKYLFPAGSALEKPWSYDKGFKTNKTNYNNEEKDKPSSLLMLSWLKLSFKCPKSCAYAGLPAD